MQNLFFKRPVRAMAVAVFAILFGVLTVKSGGAVLFGEDAARRAAGNYVPFVVWFNFFAGFAYVAAGVGLWLSRPWSTWLAVSIAVATVVVFIAFGAHALSGAPYEMRTVWAMTLRTAVWVTLAIVACRSIGCRIRG